MRKLLYILIPTLVLGIALVAYASSLGPNDCSAATNDTSSGLATWTNPSNGCGADGVYAVASFNGAVDNGAYLKVTNFGFNITAGSTINGILVEVLKRRGAGSVSATDTNAKIVKGGTIGTTNKALAGEWPTTAAYFSYGGSADLWGTTWAVSDINSSTFGFAISSDPSAFSTEDGEIDNIRITITYTLPSGSPQVQVRSGVVSVKSGLIRIK